MDPTHPEKALRILHLEDDVPDREGAG